jgi:hypothetical protein
MMQVPNAPAPVPEGQATANPAPPLSPVASRLRWLEIATRLLLLASVAIFAWAALSIFLRPLARKLIETPRYSRSPFDDADSAGGPTDFYRSDDDASPSSPRNPKSSRLRAPGTDDNDNDDDNGGKAELVAGTAIGDSKLYGQPSDKAAEMGEVRAGETVFVMKESPGWVLVLRGEGAMLGWMRRSNLSER